VSTYIYFTNLKHFIFLNRGSNPVQRRSPAVALAALLVFLAAAASLLPDESNQPLAHWDRTFSYSGEVCQTQ